MADILPNINRYWPQIFGLFCLSPRKLLMTDFFFSWDPGALAIGFAANFIGCLEQVINFF